MSKKKVTVAILLLLVFSDILETFTHFCLKKGVLEKSAFKVSRFLDVFGFILNVSSSPFLWLGLFSVLVTFIIWSTILSRIDLSAAVPIASFSYILVPLVSIVFLHEKISNLRWLGIFFIILGVIFVSLSSQEKEVGVT